MNPTKNRSRLLRWVALGLLLALLAGTAVYLGRYYHASEDALALLSHPAEGITVEELPGERLLFRPEQPTAGLIFYPGGKVEDAAYAPLLEAFARRGILCVLVHMPFHLAVFSVNAADGIARDYPEVPRWYIGGHSLGGVIASRYIAAHPENLEGLLLLAAWSTEDLSESGLSVLSVVGTEDGVLNREKLEENRSNLPADAGFVWIEGGNHAQFGSYGPQRGDNIAAISPRAQWEQTADAVAQWMARSNSEEE